jgi:hypothetical protein
MRKNLRPYISAADDGIKGLLINRRQADIDMVQENCRPSRVKKWTVTRLWS